MNLASKIRNVQDFPKPGIGFKDITTLIGDGPALRESIQEMKRLYDGEHIDKVIGIESRGFIFAAILAYEWNIGVIPVRKPGKLPAETIRATYELEYGNDSLEIHTDAIKPGERILIVDDLLATGGTVEATIELVEKLKGEVVGSCFLIELSFLGARQRLQGSRVDSLVIFDSE